MIYARLNDLILAWRARAVGFDEQARLYNAGGEPSLANECSAEARAYRDAADTLEAKLAGS